jgi:tetratricopeptide (TPR) repeat protein
MNAVSDVLDRAAADLAAGRLRESFDRVRSELTSRPNDPRALAMLGQVAVFADQPAVGLGPLQRAVALDPQPEYRIWLSLCLAKLDCREDAVREVTTAIETMRPTANAHFAIGMVFFALDQYQDAADAYTRCIELQPTRAAAHHRLARALHAIGCTETAIEAYREAVRQSSTNADYLADLSSALSDLGRFEEGRVAAAAAVERDPNCTVGLHNLGHALHNLNRGAEALAPYEKAIAIRGSYAKAQFGYALALLKSGEFASGWQHYEWRWRDCQTFRSGLGVPAWQGEDAQGQTLLLHAEQGLGDTLQFVRFAPLAAARGARVVLEVPASLVRLTRRIAGVAEVIACGDQLPRIDLHCPMASLPLAFNLRLETIPAAPYLRRDGRNSVNPVRPVDEDKLVVGLVWAGDPRQSERGSNLIDRRRSTQLEMFAPMMAIGGIRFVSFQHGQAREQIAASRLSIVDAMDGVADFADTAERLAGVDLLVSVDTSIVHLAGGLGMPVWMLSRFDGCWRWLERRDDTPWYPSMRIFRQSSLGDWSGVVAQVADALRHVVHGLPGSRKLLAKAPA